MAVFVKWGKRFLKLLVILQLLAELPYMVKYVSPSLWGKLEGTFERDLTAFCFVIGRGAGDCRIKNSKIAFQDKGAKIYLGHLTNPAVMKYKPSNYHLWGQYANGKMIDVVCPPATDPICRERSSFAIIDAASLKLEYSHPADSSDKNQIEWALHYLPALRASLRQ